jgi:organic hydroperoxide reductase OsmC/OhrA
MQDYPQVYRVSASAAAEGEVLGSAEGLPSLALLPPKQFDGPGDHWSPETLLIASVAGCFVLSFRAVAKASHFPWTALDVAAEGRLEKVERVTRFSRMKLRVRLTVPADSDHERARRLLEKAESVCLVSNTLNSERELAVEVLSD